MTPHRQERRRRLSFGRSSRRRFLEPSRVAGVSWPKHSSIAHVSEVSPASFEPVPCPRHWLKLFRRFWTAQKNIGSTISGSGSSLFPIEATRRTPGGKGRCNRFASSHGAVSHVSISSGVVRMFGPRRGQICARTHLFCGGCDHERDSTLAHRPTGVATTTRILLAVGPDKYLLDCNYPSCTSMAGVVSQSR